MWHLGRAEEPPWVKHDTPPRRDSRGGPRHVKADHPVSQVRRQLLRQYHHGGYRVNLPQRRGVHPAHRFTLVRNTSS